MAAKTKGERTWVQDQNKQNGGKGELNVLKERRLITDPDPYHPNSVYQVTFMSVLVNDICDLFERSQLKGGVPLGLSGSGSVIQDHSDYSKQG